MPHIQQAMMKKLKTVVLMYVIHYNYFLRY
nr:MAG TPA: hypothetical protein [Caudoviricetes sp.]